MREILTICCVGAAAIWLSQYVPLIQPLMVSHDDLLRQREQAIVQAEIDAAVAESLKH
jgi:hypothetical protein